MPRIKPDKLNDLIAAIHSHDHLHRLMREIEKLQYVVFHASPQSDVHRVRKSAEQILIAEIISRHKGNIDGVYTALRRMEKDGRPWPAAIRDLAGSVHSYFTTPLGIIMRRELFGEDAVFISPDALAWIEKSAG